MKSQPVLVTSLNTLQNSIKQGLGIQRSNLLSQYFAELF